MSPVLSEQLALLPEYLSRHLLLTVTALFIGIGISFPLALVITRAKVLRAPILAFASAIQTIPSLALLALMVPLLREIGFLPAAIALILYSMLPVLRNTVTGIEEVDKNLTEAGRALGMTDTQLLFKVQIPLAMPVIIAGIRTATVWVVGIATLSTPVGATSLGNYIFSGLQTQNYTAVLVGCVAAATLALVLDGLIRLMERASARRNRKAFLGALVVLILVVGIGLAPVFSSGNTRENNVLIGAKTFTEQYILARLISDQLDRAGIATRTLDSLGSTVVFDALVSGRIDVYVDYTGTIWANHMKRGDNPGRDEVFAQVSQWLDREHGVKHVIRLGFENAYALAMRRDLSESMNIATIPDLKVHAAGMVIGGDYEFFARPEWRALESAYNLSFARQISMDATLMYPAVRDDEVQVISAFSTDGRIPAFDLKVLSDPQQVIPPYDAIILLAGDRAAGLAAILAGLDGAISNDAMRRANMRIDVDGDSIQDAARALGIAD